MIDWIGAASFAPKKHSIKPERTKRIMRSFEYLFVSRACWCDRAGNWSSGVGCGAKKRRDATLPDQTLKALDTTVNVVAVVDVVVVVVVFIDAFVNSFVGCS